MRGNSLGSNSSGRFPQEAILQRITPLEELGGGQYINVAIFKFSR